MTRRNTTQPGRIGRYRIQSLVGQGGMGKVYRAYDPSLKRAVVIKVIALPNLADQEEWQRRFQREVRAAAGLQHPHIVTIYDVDLEGEPLYVVMELLTGGSLKERLRQGPLPWREALKLLRPLVEALAYAHQNGLVHRDVKPANVMFTGEETLPFQRGEGGILKLVDFGLARWRSEEQVTQTGMVIGTPAYMSPEQARGEAVDGQTDIFALGITLFEAIAGYNPLDKGSSIQTLIEATSFVKIDTSSLAGKTPPEVSQLIERAIAREREQRYPSCEALLADLDRCLDDPTATSPTLSRPSRAQRPANGSPEIRAAGDFRLTDEVKAVLRVMFAGFSTVAIETEFGRGFSSSRVFRVRLIETGGRAQLPAVVKIAPIGLIHQEQQAYQNWVEHTLSNIAHLEMSSIFGTRLWGGLRYSLVGGGAFTVESLQDYFHKASLDDLCWVVQNRLFKLLGPQWWLDGRIDRAFQMQSDYDVLLPPNLVIKLTDSPWQGQVQVIEAGDAPALARVTSGEQVQLKGFVVTKIEPEKHYLTLNLPSVLIGQSSASYQIHLGDIPDVSQYQVGHTLDIVEGEVMATRHDLLFGQISETVGQAVDLAAERLILPTPRPVPEPPSLPNPLLNYQRLLLEFVTVTISTIHGDLNMENVLVDPATREVNLIDFATVHQGHNLRDLLQLETDVVIRLIPPALAEAGLPAEIIYPLYEQLHQATIAPHQAALAQLPWPTLEKPFKLLKVIREMARKCLFDLDDWREYYRGLTLYLLGVLKYENLKSSTIAPLPRQVAFWGAATALHFLETPLSHHSAPFEGFVEVQPARAEREDPETRWPIKPPGVPANPKPYDEIEPPYGTMRPSSKFYIERTVDLHCWERLDSTEPVTLFIQAPRQMGKSSLMCRMLEQAKRLQHRRSVFIDFQKFSEQELLDEEKLLTTLCSLIGDGLRIPEAIDQYWQGRRSGIIKCSRYLSDYLIPQINEPFILAMDEVERMLTSPFRASFFGMLRTWHNDRVYNENFARLTLFLSSSTEPYLFIDNPNQSPFNVAEVFTLQDFSQEEVEELNRRHGSPLRPAQVNELMDLINGHPFLTRAALYEIATGTTADFETLLVLATDDNGPFGVHLGHYLRRVLQQPELKQALITICQNHAYEEGQIFYRLKGAGLIKKEGKQIIFRNKLYDRYFKERLHV